MFHCVNSKAVLIQTITMSDGHDLDLPLMSNIDELLVQHYILDLSLDIKNEVFTGHVIMLLELVNGQANKFTMPLGLSSSEDPRQCTKDLMTDIKKLHSQKDSDGFAMETLYDSHRNVIQYQQSHVLDINGYSSINAQQVPNACKVTETTNGQENDFVMSFDSWNLSVESVEELFLPKDTSVKHLLAVEKLLLAQNMCTYKVGQLEFKSEKNCLKVWKLGIKNSSCFPKVIKVNYCTNPKGPSLKWTKNQDGNLCVYTHGHWINNRSLFPSQDVPGAMATWAANIHVPREMVVLMSGDHNATVHLQPNGLTRYSYYTDMEVPSSTLAVAVGMWKQADIVIKESNDAMLSSKVTHACDELLPCRLFSPIVHYDVARDLIGQYVPKCMKAASSMLGSHPFKRLDILIVPSSFASLGMASPSLMFLSQSVLAADGNMLVRVAHEISHSWFGLLIGPKDWHEEWLSEGFCTYTEGVIHATALETNAEDFDVERQIQDYLKFKKLQAEVQITQTDLQVLSDKCDESQFVRNGMNPDKGFMQLHYLKGYFLLRFLENQVGRNEFCNFFKEIVLKFHHRLIDSEDVLVLFFSMFPQLKSLHFNEETIFKEWLNSPGLCKNVLQYDITDIPRAKPALKLASEVCCCNKMYRTLHWRKRRKFEISSCICFPCLKNTNIMLFLDELLKERSIHADILNFLNSHFKFDSSNPDILHMWCELVIKHKVLEHYDVVRKFLIQHQAMGVYLFGELIINRDSLQRRLAEECFHNIKGDMEEGVFTVVHAMIYGS